MDFGTFKNPANLKSASLVAPFLSLCWHDLSWFSEISWDGFPSDTVPSSFNLATKAWKLLPVWNETVVLWNDMLLIHDLTLRCQFGYLSFFERDIYLITKYHKYIMMNLLNYMIPIWFSNHTSFAILGSEPGGCSTFDLWDQRSNHTGRVAGVSLVCHEA